MRFEVQPAPGHKVNGWRGEHLQLVPLDRDAQTLRAWPTAPQTLCGAGTGKADAEPDGPCEHCQIRWVLIQDAVTVVERMRHSGGSTLVRRSPDERDAQRRHA